MTFYIILGLSAFLVSLLGTRLTILALRKRPMPSDIAILRGEKPAPVPQGGGIVVVIALVICLLVADIDYAVVLSMLLLAAMALMGKLIDIPRPVTFLVQVMAVSIPLGIMHTPLLGGVFPLWLDKAITGLLWLWFMRMFSDMDGIDGLAAAEMTGIGAGLCLLAAIAGIFPNPLSTYSLVVASAGCGFLWWNRPPAKIAFSAVGSIPAGFLTGYLLLLAANSGYVFAALILPAYCLCDSIATSIRQLHNKHAPGYYYRQAVDRGRRPASVVRYVFGMNLLLIFLATSSAIDPHVASFDLTLSYMAVFMLLGFFAHTRPGGAYEI